MTGDDGRQAELVMELSKASFTVPYFNVLSEEREGAYAPLTDIRG